MIDQTTLDEIRRLAEAAQVWAGGAPNRAFRRAANPTATIALLDALEEARLVARKATVELSALRRTYTGLRKEAEAARLERDTLRDEVARLRARLEIDHCYDGHDNRVELSPEQGDEIPDGIECRDETIRGLDERIKQYRAEVERLREALEPFVDVADFLDSETENVTDDTEFTLCLTRCDGHLIEVYTNMKAGAFRRAREAANEADHGQD